jgi:hypothetical protein
MRFARSPIASLGASYPDRVSSITPSCFAIDLRSCPEPLTRAKRDNASRRNEDRFTSFRVAAGTLPFVAQLKFAEAGQPHVFAAFQRAAHHLEKGFDQLLRFPGAETCTVMHQLGKFGLCECRFSGKYRTRRRRDIAHDRSMYRSWPLEVADHQSPKPILSHPARRVVRGRP